MLSKNSRNNSGLFAQPDMPTAMPSRPGSPKPPARSFWGPKGTTYVTILTTLLIVGLVAEWSSVRGYRTTAVQHKKLGWNDSRQLRMQASSNGYGKIQQQEAVQDSRSSSGSDDSSSSTSSSSDGGGGSSTRTGGAGRGSQIVQGTKFTEVFPNLGPTPAVQDLQPTIYGHVEKKGHLQWDHWSVKQERATARFDNFLSWRLNRTVHGRPVLDKDSYTCKASDHPKMPFPGCHVFVNHKYKYMYIRSPKAASTSIVDEFGECTNTRTRGHNASTCMGNHITWEHWYKDPKNITDMWRDYFVFGFVRNPWNRAYSLFKYMQSDGCMDGKQLERSECKIAWGDFCADPWGTSDKVHDQGCLMRSKSYMYFHMMDQHHCMVTDTGDWAVDFVGRVEQANQDWGEVVKTINKRRPANMPEIAYNELVPKNVRSGSVSDPYAGANAHCLDAVSSWYACDIEKYGYLKSARRQ